MPVTVKLDIVVVAVEPSMVNAVVSDPPSLTLKIISPFSVTFFKVVFAPDCEIVKSESTPTVNPVSFSTPNVPEVVSFASDLKNDSLEILSSVSALVAVPFNL